MLRRLKILLRGVLECILAFALGLIRHCGERVAEELLRGGTLGAAGLRVGDLVVGVWLRAPGACVREGAAQEIW